MIHCFPATGVKFFGELPDKGSNLDIQIQNLTYYHYTIRQIGRQI